MLLPCIIRSYSLCSKVNYVLSKTSYVGISQLTFALVRVHITHRRHRRQLFVKRCYTIQYLLFYMKLIRIPAFQSKRAWREKSLGEENRYREISRSKSGNQKKKIIGKQLKTGKWLKVVKWLKVGNIIPRLNERYTNQEQYLLKGEDGV